MGFFFGGGITTVSICILFLVSLFKTKSLPEGDVQRLESFEISEVKKKEIVVKETYL